MEISNNEWRLKKKLRKVFDTATLKCLRWLTTVCAFMLDLCVLEVDRITRTRADDGKPHEQK